MTTNKLANAVNKAIDLSAARYRARKAMQQAEFVARWAARVQGKVSEAEFRASMPVERGEIHV